MTGFFLINCMAQDAYASYTLLIAIFTTTSILVELGISQSLLALIGDKVDQHSIVGSYIRACQYYRIRLLITASIILAGILFIISPSYNWSLAQTLTLWIGLFISLLFYCIDSIYQPILLLKERLKSVYKAGIFATLVRLLVLIILFQYFELSVSAAILTSMIYFVINGLYIRKLALPSIDFSAAPNDLSRQRSEIKQQTLPKAPGFAFFAFEGQITVFLISALGSTGEIAEVGALGRLGLLFTVIYIAGNHLIAPAFAKQTASAVLRNSALTLSLGGFIGLSACALSALFPQFILLPLGSNYSHLQTEAFILVLGCSIRILDVFLYSICLARKYIYSWYPLVDILPVLIGMILCFIYMDLSSTRAVLELAVILTIIRLVSKAVVFATGLRKDT